MSRETPGVFRLLLPDGSIRLAAGDVAAGPRVLLEPRLSIARLLRTGRDGLRDAAATTAGEPVPDGSLVLAPVDRQEVWAAGVTYLRSHAARAEESTERTVYDRVYEADRPELFFKAAGWRVQGPGAPIGIRADSAWNVPEPELVLVVTPAMAIAGLVLGNDVSSRSIEGENPLYLPQAKVYDRSCAIGPALIPFDRVPLPVEIRLTIARAGTVVFDGRTSTDQMRRRLEELVAALGAAMTFPDGALLMTGTGIVPDAPFTLLPGDIVEIDGGPLGILENPTTLVPIPEPSDGERTGPAAR
jgi:2-dehydro-3-deoxy-D-arabinonate dehydratase